MAHKFDPKHADKLESEDFRKNLDPVGMLTGLGLTGDDTFIDIGCGTGFYLRAAAKIIAKQGKLLGVDTSRKMLRYLKNHIEPEIFAMLKLSVSREYSIPLPDATGTFALLSTVLHEVDDKVLLLAETRRVLKPRGRIAVIEFEKIDTPHGPPLHHRLSREDTCDWMEAAGFSPVSVSAISDELYACSALSAE